LIPQTKRRKKKLALEGEMRARAIVSLFSEVEGDPSSQRKKGKKKKEEIVSPQHQRRC